MKVALAIIMNALTQMGYQEKENTQKPTTKYEQRTECLEYLNKHEIGQKENKKFHAKL